MAKAGIIATETTNQLIERLKKFQELDRVRGSDPQNDPRSGSSAEIRKKLRKKRKKKKKDRNETQPKSAEDFGCVLLSVVRCRFPVVKTRQPTSGNRQLIILFDFRPI